MTPPRVWALLGEQMGDSRQVIALAEGLGWPLEIKRLQADRSHTAVLSAPWPDLVISSGRLAEKAALWVKQQSQGRTKCVHLGRSNAALTDWDLLITTAQYFLPARDNILHNGLPMHGLTDAVFLEALDAWRSRLTPLSTPCFTLILGGSTLGFPYTKRFARTVADTLNRQLSAQQGTLLISTSKRTPLPFLEVLVKALKIPYDTHVWSEGSPANPYYAFLAWADRVFVMGDSMTMLAEAASLRKPLYIVYPRGKQWWQDVRMAVGRLLLGIGSYCVPKKNRYQYAKFHTYMIAQGMAVYWDTSQEGFTVKAQLALSPLERAVMRVNQLF